MVYLCHNSNLSTWKRDEIMHALQEIEHLLTTLTRAEKAQVLQWVVRDLGEAFPGIESTPNVCGGEPCIVRTRIPVWVLAQAKRLGTSAAELLRSYPTLRAEDLAMRGPMPVRTGKRSRNKSLPTKRRDGWHESMPTRTFPCQRWRSSGTRATMS